MPVTMSAAAAAPKAPPRTRAPKTDKPLPAAVSPDARVKALNEIAAIPTAVFIALGRLADAGTIEIYWPRMSVEIARLAETQPEVARVIDPLTRVGKWTGVLTIAAPMAMQFAVNAGRVKPGAMGTVNPEMIAAQIELRIAQAEADALRQQLAAEREARETRAEIDKARQEMADA